MQELFISTYINVVLCKNIIYTHGDVNMFKYRDPFGIIKVGAKEGIMSVALNESESAVNCLMTLYLLKRANNRIDGITKLQKLVFVAQEEMARRGICAVSNEFFRWDYGPMSREVYRTNDILVENNLVKNGALTLNDRGEDFLREFDYIIKNNREIFSIIDKCVDDFSHLSLGELKEKIYSMVVLLGTECPVEIRDLPHGTTILRNKGFSSLDIDQDDIETLEICISEELHQSVLSGLDDAKSGRMSSLQTA